jgi:hypothetical protein
MQLVFKCYKDLVVHHIFQHRGLNFNLISDMERNNQQTRKIAQGRNPYCTNELLTHVH